MSQGMQQLPTVQAPVTPHPTYYFKGETNCSITVEPNENVGFPVSHELGSLELKKSFQATVSTLGEEILTLTSPQATFDLPSQSGLYVVVDAKPVSDESAECSLACVCIWFLNGTTVIGAKRKLETERVVLSGDDIKSNRLVIQSSLPTAAKVAVHCIELHELSNSALPKCEVQ